MCPPWVLTISGMDEGWRGEGRAFSYGEMLCVERFKGWNEMFRGQHIYRGIGKTEVQWIFSSD